MGTRIPFARRPLALIGFLAIAAGCIHGTGTIIGAGPEAPSPSGSPSGERSPVASGAGLKTVSVTGDAALESSRTYEESSELARNRALLRAVQEVAGQQVVSGTMLQRDEYGTTLGQFIRVFAAGNVVRLGPERWSAETTGPPNRPPDVVLKVALEATVAADTVRPDSSFLLRVALNQETYREKEDLIIEIESSQSAYLRVFNQFANGQVRQIFPNRYRRPNHVEARRPIRLAGPDDAFGLPMELPKECAFASDSSKEACECVARPLARERRSAVESIVVVATKKDIPFWEGKKGSESFLTSTGGEAMVGLSRWLASIPADERVVQSAEYTVVAR